MRRSMYMLAVATCLATPLAAAERADGPPAVAAETAPAHVAATRAQSPKSQSPKSQSALGQAMNELIRSVSESHAGATPGTPINANPMAAPRVVAVPTTTPPGERATAAPADAKTPPVAQGERQDQVAVQSGPDNPH